uniref:Putative plant transposon protein domain-containing protein n=1 Tax=Solanum tuberosum TaxID=4113 RepID=M1DTF3_SOLTU
MVQILHSNGKFTGLPYEDPQIHLRTFIDITNTYIPIGVSSDYAANWCEVCGSGTHETEKCEANLDSVNYVGGLSGDTEPNPKQLHAVSTRSGLQLEEIAPKKRDTEVSHKEKNVEEVVKSSNVEVTMAPKAKSVAGSKRSRKGEASGSGNREPVGKFEKKAVERFGWEWFECQRKPKYMGDEYVHEVRLLSQFPVIYRTVLELGLRFIFDHLRDCNLPLVREFYANWLTETKYKTIPIRGKDVKFNAATLNEFLGTPNCDSDVFNTLKDKPPYRDIRHTLCGVESMARWERSKDTGRHKTLHFANFNQVARVWLKIVCSVLLPTKHLTEGIEEEVVDLTIAFHPDLRGKLVDVTRTKALDTSHGPVLSAQERQARDDSVIARMFGMAELQLRIGGSPVTDAEMETMAERYPLSESAAFLCKTGPAFLEPLDDEEATADEAMDDEEDDVVDEETNALMVFDGGDDEA